MVSTATNIIGSVFLIALGLTAIIGTESISGSFTHHDDQRRYRRHTTFDDARHYDSYRRNYQSLYSPETTAKFLSNVNYQLRLLKHGLAEATWNFQMNGSVGNRYTLSNITEHYNNWYVLRQEEALMHKNNPSLSEDMARQLDVFSLSAIGKSKEMRKRQTNLQNALETIYNIEVEKLSKKTPTEYHPIDLLTVMATSRDPDRLKMAWVNWRNAIGPPIKFFYQEFVDVLNLAANENGFTDHSAYWKQSLFPATPDLDAMLHNLWGQIRPLYLQLHAYVRHKLTLRYGASVVGTDGSIPAHLLGDMWAQHWNHINDILSPYPDIDDTLFIDTELKKRFTAIDMFRLAEDFYTSLGFPEMMQQFWRKSHFERTPGERYGDGACEAAAYDLYKAGDYRIKMCAKVSLSDLKTIYHEMGHIEYFMAYSNQPTLHRAPPSAAFHESVGDIAQLSLMSEKRLQALGLAHNQSSRRGRYSKWKRKTERSYNQLMQVALDKLAFLPFGLIVDRWRWQVFQGNITPDSYNRKWWDFRLQYQGVKPPVPRSERDFDPGAKYHIPAHMPFASYFVAYIQEFQVYNALCDSSGHRGLLHECDLYGSQEAGQKLRNILKAGSSRPWQEQLKSLTGSDTVTADAILEYFRPLRKWLERYNAFHDQTIGWDAEIVELNMK